MNVSVLGAGSTGRATITTTVGYVCLAFCVWMLSMTSAGWFAQVFPRTLSMLLPLAVILAIVGILAFINERTLDAVLFLGAAGYFWSAQGFFAGLGSGAGDPPHYDAWYSFIWAIFVAYLWLAVRRADSLRMLYLLAVWLDLLALAIAGWASLHVFTRIGGYLGLISGVLALLVSARAILGYETHDRHQAGAAAT